MNKVNTLILKTVMNVTNVFEEIRFPIEKATNKTLVDRVYCYYSKYGIVNLPDVKVT